MLDQRGRSLTNRTPIPTPKRATPHRRIAVIRKLAKVEGKFDRVLVGFPGVAKNGLIYTAPKLGKGWNNFALGQKLRRELKRPVRVANDADVQGLGSISGRGVELAITLGTGVGSVISSMAIASIWSSDIIRSARARPTRTSWAIGCCSRTVRGGEISGYARRSRTSRSRSTTTGSSLAAAMPSSSVLNCLRT
ncbi:MAG: ROK family protein [Bryobacteraceae bacterium]